MLAIDLDRAVSAPELARRALLEQRLVVNATGPGRSASSPRWSFRRRDRRGAGARGWRSAGRDERGSDFLPAGPDEPGGCRRDAERSLGGGRRAVGETDRTFYDTFDGLMRGAGLSVIHEAGRLALVDRESGRGAGAAFRRPADAAAARVRDSTLGRCATRCCRSSTSAPCCRSSTSTAGRGR